MVRKTSKSSAGKTNEKSLNKIYLEMVDAYIDQIEKFAPAYLTTLENAQDFYIKGLKKTLEITKDLGNRTKIKIPFAKETADIIENVNLATIKAQNVLANAYINTGIEVVKSTRATLNKL